MDTAAVGYRIVDFLKTNPPFSAVSDTDLLALTTAGRVKFYEANDFILWQGEPHKAYVFVIQQGTVSLWDDSGDRSTLRDIRGAGDLLGIERFSGARSCLQSAKAESDVLIYAFAEADFRALLEKYPHARDYVAAYGSVTAYQSADHRRDARHVFLHDVVGRRSVVSCAATDRISEVARRLLDCGLGGDCGARRRPSGIGCPDDGTPRRMDRGRWRRCRTDRRRPAARAADHDWRRRFGHRRRAGDGRRQRRCARLDDRRAVWRAGARRRHVARSGADLWGPALVDPERHRCSHRAPAVARPEPAGARLRASLPHGRGVCRLARALHPPRRCRHRRTAHQLDRASKSEGLLVFQRLGRA